MDLEPIRFIAQCFYAVDALKFTAQKNVLSSQNKHDLKQETALKNK